MTYAAAHEPPLFENGGFQFIGLQVGLFYGVPVYVVMQCNSR